MPLKRLENLENDILTGSQVEISMGAMTTSPYLTSSGTAAYAGTSGTAATALYARTAGTSGYAGTAGVANTVGTGGVTGTYFVGIAATSGTTTKQLVFVGGILVGG